MSKWRDIAAEALHALALRVVPLLVGALLGILTDAGLLGGEVSDAAVQVLGPSGSSSNK